jgi:hypothetical protein
VGCLGCAGWWVGSDNFGESVEEEVHDLGVFFPDDSEVAVVYQDVVVYEGFYQEVVVYEGG